VACRLRRLALVQEGWQAEAVARAVGRGHVFVVEVLDGPSLAALRQGERYRLLESPRFLHGLGAVLAVDLMLNDRTRYCMVDEAENAAMDVSSIFWARCADHEDGEFALTLSGSSMQPLEDVSDRTDYCTAVRRVCTQLRVAAEANRIESADVQQHQRRRRLCTPMQRVVDALHRATGVQIGVSGGLLVERGLIAAATRLGDLAQSPEVLHWRDPSVDADERKEVTGQEEEAAEAEAEEGKARRQGSSAPRGAGDEASSPRSTSAPPSGSALARLDSNQAASTEPTTPFEAGKAVVESVAHIYRSVLCAESSLLGTQGSERVEVQGVECNHHSVVRYISLQIPSWQPPPKATASTASDAIAHEADEGSGVLVVLVVHLARAHALVVLEKD
jgi:hypothetical protein